MTRPLIAKQVLIDQVQSMYIGYYGRPGDPAGVDYWVGRLEAVGGNLDAIVDAFGYSDEYLQRFGSLSAADMINAFYQQIFNRAADPAGMGYYLGELNAGRMTLATIAKNIWDGAINEDALIVSNKLAVASYATERVDSENRLYAADDIDAVAAALAKVDHTAPGLFAGLEAVDLLIDDLPDRDPQTFELPAAVSVTEGDSALLTVTLPVYAGTAELSYRVESDSAAGQVDFASQQGRLSFAPGETQKTISIQTFNDLLLEPTESFLVVFENPAFAMLPGAASSVEVSVEILDDTAAAAAGPTDLEQYYLELVNRARADPATEAARFGIDLNEGLAPGTLGAEARQPLAYDAQLTEAARAHAQWLLDTDSFSHTGADGSSVAERIEAAGYTDWWTYGENLAWKGSTGGYGELVGWVDDLHRNLFVDEGIAGRGHRLNLLDDDFRESGTGILLGGFEQYDAIMLANDLATRQSASDILTGVVFDDRNGDLFYTPGEGIGDVLVQVIGSAGNYSTHTTDSGGYQLALPGGAYAVEFVAPGGDTLDADIALIGINEKLDWIL
jgi:hypothetical protein